MGPRSRSLSPALSPARPTTTNQPPVSFGTWEAGRPRAHRPCCRTVPLTRGPEPATHARDPPSSEINLARTAGPPSGEYSPRPRMTLENPARHQQRGERARVTRGPLDRGARPRGRPDRGPRRMPRYGRTTVLGFVGYPGRIARQCIIAHLRMHPAGNLIRFIYPELHNDFNLSDPFVYSIFVLCHHTTCPGPVPFLSFVFFFQHLLGFSNDSAPFCSMV